MVKEIEDQDNQDQDKDKNDNLVVAQLKVQLAEAQSSLQALQEQSQQSKLSDQQKAQELEIVRKAEETARLAEEADLKKVLETIETDKYESLTNKEIIDVVINAIDSTSDARGKQINQLIDEKISAVNTNVKNTQKAVMQIATAMDISDTRKTHSDFDEFQKDAATIMQDTPGLSVKDAYLLAKARQVESVPSKKETDRERPDTTVSRSSGNQAAEEIIERRNQQENRASDRRTNQNRGITGARSIIDAGIDRVQARRS